MQLDMKARKASKSVKTYEAVTPDEMRVTLNRFRPFVKGKQLALAAALRIDQGQLSKILRGEFALANGHAMTVFAYAKERLGEAPDVPARGPLLEVQLTQKLFAAWDGTHEGATALGVLLDGAAQLIHRR